MNLIMKARDSFYTLRRGRKISRVDQIKKLWIKRGWNYFEEQEKGIKEKGIEYFAQNELFKFIAKNEFSTILELGCGYGWNINRLFQEYPDKIIYGIDFSRSQISRSKIIYPQLWNNGRVIILENDITNMSLADKSIDVSFSLGILMNIPPADILKGLKEIIRVTRDKIILFEYFKPNVESREYIETAEKHPYIFSHNYEKLMRRLGCKLISLDENKGTASKRYTFYEFKATR